MISRIPGHLCSVITAALLSFGCAAAAQQEVISSQEHKRRETICFAAEDWLQRPCFEQLKSVVVKEPAPEPHRLASHELHLVGIYEPRLTLAENGSTLRGSVDVHIDRPGKSVTLFLTSYDATQWNLHPSPGTIVARIIVGGYTPERSDVQVHETPAVFTRIQTPSAYETNKAQKFERYIRAALRETGFPRAHSFNGSYRAPQDGFAITLGSGVLTREDLLENALEWSALPQAMQDVLSGASLPAATLWSLNDYGFVGKSGANNMPIRIPLPPELPTVSSPVQATSDPQGNHLWGVTLGGEGYLYEHNFADGSWNAWSMNNVDVGGLIYDTAKDRLITSPKSHFGGTFRIMDRRANVLEAITIPQGAFPGMIELGAGWRDAMEGMDLLAVVGDEVLVRMRTRRQQYSYKPLTYLVNLATKEVRLVR